MKRRPPRPANAAVVVSAIVCIAMAVLCCRSYVTRDDTGFAGNYLSPDPHKRYYDAMVLNLESNRGQLDLEWFYRFVPLPSELPPAFPTAIEPPHPYWNSGPALPVADITGLTSRIHQFGPVEWTWFHLGDPKPQVGGNYEQHRALRVPHWLLIVLLGVLPARRGWKLIRDRRHADRLDQSLCHACGYDLRATPDRCPECGTRAPARL